MKRILLIVLISSQCLYAMDNGPRYPRLLGTSIPMLVSILRKTVSLTDTDIRKALVLLKEIRAQSPSVAFVYSEQLRNKMIHHSIETDSRLEVDSMLSGKQGGREAIRRAPSPLRVIE